MLNGMGFSQYFPAAWEYNVVEKGFVNSYEHLIFSVRVTGVIDGRRSYGHPILVKAGDYDPYTIYKLFDTSRYPHILVELGEKREGDYLIAIRIVKTENFIVAEVPRVDIGYLKKVAEKLLEIDKVRAMAFDVTPKPPATIGYE
ncbi:MAG: hypothetical protein QW200_06150 [Ignisphaera sp.]